MTAFLRGADRFQQDIGLSIKDLQDLSVPMRAAGGTVQRAAQARAPKLTGRLASSLTPRAEQMAVEVNSTLVYANVIHWGWRAHGIEGRPFLTTAARGTEPKWIQGFERQVDQTLDRMDRVYG